MKSRLLRIGAIALLSATTVGMASAATISFTSAEGYSNGNLNGQPSGSSDWNVLFGSTAYQVDASGAGALNLSTAATSGVAINQSSADFTTDLVFTTSFDFVLDQTGQATGNTSIVTLRYFSNPSGGSLGPTNVGIGRTAATDGYRFTTFSTTSQTFAGSEIGIDSGGGDTTSDLLRITLTLQRGATGTDWIGEASLFNVTTSSVVISNSSSSLNLSGVQTDTSLFSGFNIESGITGLTSFTVQDFMTPTAVPEPGVLGLLGLGTVLAVATRRRRRC